MSVLQQFIEETSVDTDNVVSFREARAQRIRELAQQWAENTIQLGKELKAVRDTFPETDRRGAAFKRPGWREWLAENIEFSESHAMNLIRVAEMFGDRFGGAPAVGSFRVLEFLTKSTIPESGREEVLDRLQNGEVIGRDKAAEIINKHRPKPEEARRIARETGKPTLASDNNIYLGASKEQEQQTEERRKIVYDIRDAVASLASIEMTADEFLSFALPHQLWNKSEEHMIEEAYDWLTDLVAAWERR